MWANDYLEFGKRRMRVASLRPHGGLLHESRKLRVL